MTNPAIVVFGVGSDASVDQWDSCGATRGIMLRWFLPDLDFPQLGFDVYRAAIPDIPPLPFDDINVAAVSGKSSWDYAGIVTLSCANGLTFEPTGVSGWNALVVTPNAPVRVRFNGTAWRIQINAAPIGAGIEVVALVDGDETLRETLDQPNAQLLWRTRHVSEIVLRGEGTVSFIGFHLLDDSRFWTHITHRCLPVDDAGYACAPRGAATEEEEAAMRLPAAVSADWKERFSKPFKAMLPALRRLARGDAPAPIPPDSLDPRHPTIATEGGSNEQALVRIALLDPHVARMLGLAYDDPVSLNGQEYAYKVTGLWRGARRDVQGARLTLDDFFKRLRKAGARVESSVRNGRATIEFPDAVIDFVLDIDERSTLEWVAQDDLGNESNDILDRKRRTLVLPRVAALRLHWTVGSDPVFTRASWHVIERRTGVLPSVYARDPGPPVGPASIDATVQLPASPSGIASAALDWPLPIGSDGGATLEGEVIAYQVGRRFLGAPASSIAPATVPATAGDVPRPLAPLYLSQQSIAGAPPRKLHVDYNDGRGLGPGWWGWWVRGVDLFGRVSAASSWDVGKVKDIAPPPAPVLVQAEWVQRSLPPMTIAVVGRSVEAARWLTGTKDDMPMPEAGLVVAWALPPEQAALRDDIDGFRLFLRKAAVRPGAAADAPLEYEDWPPAALANAALAQFGPLQIVGRGMIVSVTPDPQLAVTLSAGESAPEAPQSPTAPANPPLARTAYRTDLTLDGASGVFVGGTLTIGGRALTVVSSGDGPNLIVVVEHPGNATPPAAGAATLRAVANRLVNFETDVPDLPGVGGLSVRSGLLLDEKATPARFAVLRKRGDEFLCVNPPPPSPLPPDYVAVAPAAGHEIAWHPVWFASLSDTGFGPVAVPRKPVVNAQVAVQAVRLVQTLALPSARSATLTVTAVDVAPPPTPAITTIPFDPADTCAELATRADWYGDSRFTFSWTSQADCTFTVYRALADEVFRLDREHVRRPATRDLAQGRWPAGVWTDTARKTRVLQELSAIDAALAAAPLADVDARAALIDAVYDAACNDTQMFLGLQPHTWAAFTPLFGRPIETSSYTDTLNGRTRAHWLYAVTARSLAGVESLPSTISPPICCPDVVPPAPPLAHSALAAEGVVKLKWLASPDADTHHYEVYAAREPEAVANLDTLMPVLTYSGYELRLMSVNTADGLLDEGRIVVIVALVGADLHIRIFDANGNRAVNKSENELTRGETLTTLKEQLNPLPEESSLSQEQKQLIIWDATSIAGYKPYGVQQGAPRAATPATPQYAPMPHVSGQTIERFVPRARNEMGEWCFWIVATDTAGNRSEPSRMLRGRALQPAPLPPVWVSAARTGDRVDLVWTYPQEYAEDPRWMCQVERRVAGGTMWRVVSPQLPRAVYRFSDALRDLVSGWDYRLVVTDHLGQIAPTRPLQSVPPAGT